MSEDNITGIQHIGLPVKDSAETVAFYGKLGFVPAFETMNGSSKVVFLKKGNCVIETYEVQDPALESGAWDHMALCVVDIEQAWQDIVVGLGCKCLDKEIRSLPFWEAGVRFFTIVGPNQEKIE
ncbi:MAG: VOC family protein, partial [Sphaerochaetaceae bacterium]